MAASPLSILFFFNDTATTEIYTLSLHDALPIYPDSDRSGWRRRNGPPPDPGRDRSRTARSEEQTSELQSQSNLVCRLLLEKKKKNQTTQSDQNDISIINRSNKLAPGDRGLMCIC